MDESATNSKEQELLRSKFYSRDMMINAQLIFNQFVERVESETVRNDGSDELLSVLDKYVLSSNNPFYKTLRRETSLYRARILDEDLLSVDKGIGLSETGLIGLNESESREAPLGLSSSGRNNIKGVSYFYAASDVETACCEVKPGIRQLISVARFETKDTFHIIDFSSDKSFAGYEESFSLGHLFTKIMFMYSKPVSSEKQYKATQIITDYIRKTGIDGISYRSFYNSTGINYTIFNSDHRKLEFIESRLLMFQSERKTFLDFNNEKVITANSVGGATYDKASAEKNISDIKYALANKK